MLKTISRNSGRRSMVRNANYFIGEAIAGIFRNKLMSASSVAIIASCVFIVVFSICLALNVSFIFRQMEASTGVLAFLEDGLTNAQKDALRARVLEIDNVSAVTYVPADEGLEMMIERHNDPGLSRFRIGDNPLPDLFEIELSDTRQTTAVVDALHELAYYGYGIETISYLGDVLNVFIMINNFIVAVSVVIILILGGLSVLIVVNTIKLTVNNRKNEISIMKYVGATDMFVRWPFIAEGVLIGLFGAALPVLIAVLAYNGVIQALYNNLGFVAQLFAFRTAGEIFPLLAPLAMIIGAAIGVVGSVLSLRRYLQV